VQAASGSTPEEIIDAAYGELRSALADELVERVKAQTPEFFEDLVLDVLIAMGYGGTRADAAERLGRSGDGGIDGVIREDALGLLGMRERLALVGGTLAIESARGEGTALVAYVPAPTAQTTP